MAGFMKPDFVSLIKEGKQDEFLISPRSAKEYGVEQNGADSNEVPVAVEMGAGEISKDDILKELGTGVYVNNAWYLNYSDKQGCKMTGMTRFACFWVKDGKISAPLNVMRFDESIYRMLGENLIGLTKEK